MTTLSQAAICLLALVAVPATASAQMGSEPWSSQRKGSVGMSAAYRQAIIDEELTGRRPEYLPRGADGNLVDVVEGPGGVALAQPQPRLNVVAPQSEARGRELGYGVPASRSWGYLDLGPTRTSATIDSWTGMVMALGPRPE